VPVYLRPRISGVSDSVTPIPVRAHPGLTPSPIGDHGPNESDCRDDSNDQGDRANRVQDDLNGVWHDRLAYTLNGVGLVSPSIVVALPFRRRAG
jgi:hypothetical protein